MAGHVGLTVNGERVDLWIEHPDRPLLDVLREDLGLTGSKRGCAIGYCGTCTVLVDGEAVPACLLMVGLLDGADVRTVEGLEGPDGLDPVQQAFIERTGLQCGFCTPGHLMASRHLLDHVEDPGEDAIRASVDGVYCRCTGYVRIIESVEAAARIESGGGR